MPLELWVQAARLGLRIVEVAVPLIYLDERRSFGGALDHAATRLEVYRSVLDRAMRRPIAGDCPNFRPHCRPRTGRQMGLSRSQVLKLTLGRSWCRQPAALPPRENRALLVEPPLEDVGGLVAENVAKRDRHDYDFHGRSLAELPLAGPGRAVGRGPALDGGLSGCRRSAARPPTGTIPAARSSWPATSRSCSTPGCG